MAPPKNKDAPRGTVHGAVLSGLVNFTIRAVPLPLPIINFLQSHTASIANMLSQDRTQTDTEEASDARDAVEGTHEHGKTLPSEQFWTQLEQLFRKAGGEWVGAADRIWGFGPKKLGANLLLDPIGKTSLRSVHVSRSVSSLTSNRFRGKERLIAVARAEGKSADEALASSDQAVTQEQLASITAYESDARAELRLLQDFENSIEAGFQIATFQGPLCSEPVVGMAWAVEKIEFNREEEDSEAGRGRMSAVVGGLISSVRDACRTGMLDWSPRIKLAMYTCDIQASTDVLGKVYGVVARRRGHIISEEMKEGTSFFTIRAMLPVVESFGFADEIRKRTSGAASPQLIFSGFETLDLDPFWVPSTMEELEDLGEKSDRANVAKVYVEGVRKRKGMFVEKKIVEFAEKQRTLKR